MLDAQLVNTMLARKAEPPTSEKAAGGIEDDDVRRLDDDSEIPPSGSVLPLSRPDDSEHLSGRACLVRSQLEVFVCTRFDLSRGAPRGGVGAGGVKIGRVGIRCVHCGGGSKSPDPRLPLGACGAPQGAASFPRSMTLAYQSIRNWQRYHLKTCPNMPKEVLEEFEKNSRGTGSRKRGGTSVESYWEDGLRNMGLVDTDQGIRVGEGGFGYKDGGCKGEGEEDDEERRCVVGKRDDKNHVAGGTDKVPIGVEFKAGTIGIDVPAFTDEDAPGRKRGAACEGLNEKEIGAVGAMTAPGGTDVRTNANALHIHPPTSSNEGIEGECMGDLVREGWTPTFSPLVQEYKATPLISATKGGKHIPPLEVGERPSISSSESSPDPNSLSSSPPVQEHQVRSPISSVTKGGENTISDLAHHHSPSDEALLRKVKIASELVRAATLICPLSPQTKKEEAADASPQDIDIVLSNLGADLYEHFSGIAPPQFHAGFPGTATDRNEKEDCSDDRSDRGHQIKRERRRDYAESENCVPLAELGLPAALSCVVSSLMDHGTSNCGSSDYTSIEQVEEDLRLMAEEPDRFLFCKANGRLWFSGNAIYGRDEETAALMRAFEETRSAESSTSRMVLVSGYSGTGKSAFVQAMNVELAQRGACFVSGKFDAMRQPRPLSAIASALDDYCAILSRDEGRIDGVRKAIAAALGGEGAVLAGLIPNLKKLLSSDVSSGDSASHVTGREAFQRTIFLFRMLFWATCNKDHPVVLFLDDLQWADEVSLELMESLVTDTMIEGLLLVGSYRDNEVGADHLLTAHLGNIRRSKNVAVVPIHMTNLDSRSVNLLVSSSLRLAPRTTRALSDVVLKKTGGNALFAVQFLTSLYDEGLLYFSLTSRCWEFDVDQIQNKGIADNVVELMTAKLLRLAPEVQEALSVAASFGATCDESLLRVLDRSPDMIMSTLVALDVAVTEGLMVKSGTVYRFSHDQIQHAAYLLIPESECKAFHLRLGRTLWKLSSAEETEALLFFMVNQLHRGSSLISDSNERVMLARLSLTAGEMATALSSFLPASSYLKAAIGLLTEDDWHLNRQLCFDVYNLCAETESVLGDFDGIEGHIETVLAQARTLEEKLRPYYTLVKSLGAQGRSNDAIIAATAVINQLGEKFPLPDDVTGTDVKKEIGMTMKMLATEDEDSLLRLKTLEGESAEKHTMRFIHELLFLTYFERRSFFPIPACRIVRLSLVHGVCRESAAGFGAYGVINCLALGNFAQGYRFGKLALSINERFQDNELLAKVYTPVYCVINNWTEPAQACLPPLKRAIEVGRITGDTVFSMFHAFTHSAISFAVGKELGQLRKDMKMYSQQMLTYNQHRTHLHSRPFEQAVLNLLGCSENPIEMTGEAMDEISLSASDVESSTLFAHYVHSVGMWLEYMFGEYRLAWGKAKTGIWEKPAALIPTWCYNIFYCCLTALALARVDGEAEYLETISKTMAQMTVWAKSTPWNCQNKLELMKAEYAYLKGDHDLARGCFELSIKLSIKHRFIHEQALALERFGVFHLETGNHATACVLLKRAQKFYNQWGALSKVTHINEQYL